ncbi:MAG: hypothetical protein ACI87E_004080 [Mariniblastus sp.]
MLGFRILETQKCRLAIVIWFLDLSLAGARRVALLVSVVDDDGETEFTRKGC